MKVAVFLAVCFLVGSANANGFTDFFQQLGSSLTTTLHPLVDQAKTVGAGLLSQLAQTGTQLASQALAALSQKLLNPGAQTGTQPQPAVMPANTGTRDLNSFFSHLGLNLDTMKHQLQEQFGHLHQLTNGALDKLHHLTGEVGTLDFHPDKLAEKVDQVVHSHHQLTDGILGNVVKTIQTALHNVANAHPTITKRNGFTDAMSAAGSSLASFFKPHLDTLKQLVAGVGTAVKQAGAAVASQLHQSVSQLGTKLQGHLSALNNSGHAILQHGTNALGALKAAVTDILAQTMTNIQPHLTNIVQTGQSALATTAQHVAHTLGTLGTTNTQTST